MIAKIKDGRISELQKTIELQKDTIKTLDELVMIQDMRIESLEKRLKVYEE